MLPVSSFDGGIAAIGERGFESRRFRLSDIAYHLQALYRFSSARSLSPSRFTGEIVSATYPTEEQQQILARTFGCARFAYNWALRLAYRCVLSAARARLLQ